MGNSEILFTVLSQQFNTPGTPEAHDRTEQR